MKYYIHCLKNYFNFKDRASRKEFWYFWLIYLITYILLSLFDYAMIYSKEKMTYFDFMFIETIEIDEMLCSYLYSLYCLIPSLSLTVRRLKDLDKNIFIIVLLSSCILIDRIIGLIVFLQINYINQIVGYVMICYLPIYIWFIILMFKKGTDNINRYGKETLLEIKFKEANL